MPATDATRSPAETSDVDKDPPNTKVKGFLQGKGLTVHKFIGKGSYSRVYLATATNIKKKVALKLIDTSQKNEYVRRFLPREIEIVQKIVHDNIARVHAVMVIKDMNITCMTTEFCSNGDLLKKIQKMNFIPEKESKFLFRQLIEALKYLVSKDIVHRDLKCENVFLDKYENVKLGDFGFARKLSQGEKSNTYCGSRAYVAPEILRGVEYTGKTVDVWSAGVVLYVMTTGFMPYDDRNVTKMVDRQLRHKVRYPRRSNLSMELRTLIYTILHPHPTSRPSYVHICASEWMEGVEYKMRTGEDLKTAVGSQSKSHSTESHSEEEKH